MKMRYSIVVSSSYFVGSAGAHVYHGRPEMVWRTFIACVLGAIVLELVGRIVKFQVV